MSDLHLPDYTPVYPISKVVRPRQRRAKLPDSGTEQAKTVGQNQTSPEWSIRWVLKPIEANTLDLFFAERAKNGEWFLWTPPNGLGGRFRCDEWTKNVAYCDIWEVQATFRQVYGYDLPGFGASVGLLQLSGSAQLAQTYTWSTNAGAFALTGNDPALMVNTPIFVDFGSFALTGSDIGFSRTYVENAAQGTLILTGQNAGLVFFSLTGGYFSSMFEQIYGWDRDFQVDWWGD